MLEADGHTESFGMLLKGFRRNRRLSQQQLADAIGVHRHSIRRWEQGDFLPEQKTLVLELARCLRLTDHQARQLLEASLTALAPYWSVPLPRNPFFTGRQEILAQLHTSIGASKTVVLTQSYALHGLGGVGKTQTALEYAYRYALDYSAVFWIAAETSEQVVSSLLRIAEVLQLPECRETDQQRIITATQRWLTKHNQWLLIWDNLEELELLQRFLPPTRQGEILITTRHQALGMLAQGVDLMPMRQEEGIVCVLRRAKLLEMATTSEQMQQFEMRMPAEYAAAAELVTIMGGLPLALDQAGAYIEETGCSLVDYLQRYKQQNVHLLERRGKPGSDHPQSVVTTFLLAMERVEQLNPAALELLRLCAFLSPDAIPEEIFLADASHLGPILGQVVADPTQFDLALAALRTFSLIQRYPETHTLSIHRLVQAVLRERMGQHEQWQRRTIHLLSEVFPEISHHSWTQGARLLQHVLTCTATIPDETCNEDLAEVLRKAADYLRERARFEQSEPLYQRALRIEEQMGGSTHPRMAAPLYGLALLYYDQAKYEQAVPLCQQALHIWEQILESDHPELARPLNGLTIIYIGQGKYKEAEPLCQQSLQIREMALGPEHPLLITPLANLADIYNELGKYEQAEPLYQRAIRIHEQSQGGERPQIAYPLYGLAHLYLRQGKYEQAEPLFQRALHVREQELGAEHPYVAEPLTGLAIIAFHQGKYTQAEEWYQRALYLCEHTLGPNHPNVATPLTHLANLYTKLEKYEQAEQLYLHALHIREQYLGSQHPETAQTLHDFAIFSQQQGYMLEAASLFERALSIRTQSLGISHPKTVSTQTRYTHLLQTLEPMDAEELHT